MRGTSVALLGLAAGVAAVYGQTLGFGFVFDDASYIQTNHWLQQGLGAASLHWALVTSYMSNWHPLTWLSYLVDFELYGLAPAGYHATNVLLHLLATCLLFGWLREATGREGRSALVAALFALHPLHVESVAWVSERKDVLSACFGIGSLWAYTRYARGGGARAYGLAALALALGLTAKQMLVTLPFLFLLIDVWPLGRLTWARAEPGAPGLRRLLLEKLPLLALSAAASVLALRAQHRMVEAGAGIPFDLRIANALHAYAWYLCKAFWPSGLALHYPHPYLAYSGGQPLGPALVAASALLLAAVTLLALAARHRPYAAVGWLWFLGTLVPVIGLVPVGTQAFADRYTYLPLVGLFLAAVWGASDACEALVRRGALPARAPAALALGLVAACVVAAHAQAAFWRDPVSVFGRGVAVSPRDTVMQAYLGIAYQERGDDAQAIPHFQAALAVDPRTPQLHFQLGLAYGRQHELEAAAKQYEEALAYLPDAPEIHTNLGGVQLLRGDVDGALEHFQRAAELAPDDPHVHVNLASVLRRQGRIEDALRELRTAVRLEPRSLVPALQLGKTLGEAGRFEEAIAIFQEILQHQPDNREARRGLELAQRLRRRSAG